MARSQDFLPVLVVLCLSGLLWQPALGSPAGQEEMASSATPAPSSSAPEAAPSAASSVAPKLRATSTTTSNNQSIPEFFPQINGDLTLVTWAHAVNNKSYLASCLVTTSILMLEADVVMGTTPNDTQTVPVMGHPPQNTSDLSLETFLREVVKYNKDNVSHRKGVKLDFKSIEVFEQAIGTLKATFGGVPSFPVWLNADILHGPVNATSVPVNATSFLTLAKSEFPELMLSLGWTTRWGSDLGAENQKDLTAEARYTTSLVQEMVNVIKANSVTQPITYAVRAAFAANSLETLQTLLANTSDDATLSIWMSNAYDEFDVATLRKNILTIGQSRVYIDLPADIEKSLNLPHSSAVGIAASTSVLAAALALVCGLVR